MTPSPSADTPLTLLGDFSARWKLQANDLGHVRKAFGEDVFDAFCRSFVHSDRLTSLAQLLILNSKALPPDSVAYGRNTLTLLWLTVGTLREMALALRDLRAALKKRLWLDSVSGPLQKLKEIESRWEDNALYRALRDKGAFHVDRDVIHAGVQALLSRPGPILLAEGNGHTDHEMSLSVGAEALLLGLHPDAEVLHAALRSVHADHKVYLLLQELFVLAADRAALQLDQTPLQGSELI